MTRQTSLPNELTDVNYLPSSATGLSTPVHHGKKPAKKKPVLLPYIRMTSSTQVTSNSSRTILGENKRRVYLLLQNTGTATIYLGFGNLASLNGDNAIELPAGSQIDFSAKVCPNNAINAVSSTQGRLAILEGTF